MYVNQALDNGRGAQNKSFVHLFKGGGVQRQSLWSRSAEREIPPAAPEKGFRKLQARRGLSVFAGRQTAPRKLQGSGLRYPGFRHSAQLLIRIMYITWSPLHVKAFFRAVPKSFDMEKLRLPAGTGKRSRAQSMGMVSSRTAWTTQRVE